MGRRQQDACARSSARRLARDGVAARGATWYREAAGSAVAHHAARPRARRDDVRARLLARMQARAAPWHACHDICDARLRHAAAHVLRRQRRMRPAWQRAVPAEGRSRALPEGCHNAADTRSREDPPVHWRRDVGSRGPPVHWRRDVGSRGDWAAARRTAHVIRGPMRAATSPYRPSPTLPRTVNVCMSHGP